MKPEIESPMKGNPNLLKLQEERVIRVKASARNVVSLVDVKKSPKMNCGKAGSSMGLLLHPEYAVHQKLSNKDIKVDSKKIFGHKSIDIQQSNEQIPRFSAEQGSHRKIMKVKSSTKDSNKVIYEAISNASKSSLKRKEHNNDL